MSQNDDSNYKPSQAEADEYGEVYRKALGSVLQTEKRRKVLWSPQAGAQQITLRSNVFELLLHGSRGCGKMQSLDSMVRSRMGWTRMGDLKIGSMVLTPRGTLVPVTHIFDHKDKSMYRVTMRDGSSTLAGAEHLWKYKVVGQKRKAHSTDWHINDTIEMKRWLDLDQAVLIPTVDPLEFRRHPRHKYPVDPYLLGLWLGDGNTLGSDKITAVRMTSGESEIIDYVRKFNFIKSHKNAEIEWRLNRGDDIFGVWEGLSNLDLGGTKAQTKFVPRMYREGSIEVRLAILQGLMDTDGYAATNGGCSFTSTSEQLAKDVQYICRSLGAKATMNQHESWLNGERHSDHYDIYIQEAGKFDLFRLKRKADRVTPYMHAELCHRVDSIEYIGDMDARCIAIDDIEHLYVTDDFIVTHNSDVILMDYLREVGKGYGPAWAGVLFRESYPQLGNIVAKSLLWFPRAFPDAKFNQSKMSWTFGDGEVLLFRHINRFSDHTKYQGHEYPWICFEELCNWFEERIYTIMFACCRTGQKGIPRRIRSTANSYGVGSNWVKGRFDLAGKWWKINYQPEPKGSMGNIERPRIAIHSHVDENKILLAADPHYKDTIASAVSNPAMAKSWLDGDWDIIAGGMFDDVWGKYNEIPDIRIPDSWKIDRGFDWGSSAPFAVLWFAQSDGSDVYVEGVGWKATCRGDLFLVKEYYGWNGRPNEGCKMLATEIAQAIIEKELLWGWRKRGTDECRVKPGPADTSIYTEENGMCIAVDMAKPVRIDGHVYKGVAWTRADKSPGTRKAGWEIMRTFIKNARPKKGLPREVPGLFAVGGNCPHFTRTLVGAPRDEKDMDDILTTSEDHLLDTSRYRCMKSRDLISSGVTIGSF